MKTILFLLMLSGTAMAQGVTQGGTCMKDGAIWGVTSEEACRSLNGRFVKMSDYFVASSSGQVLTPPNPKCPVGTTLVLMQTRSTMADYKCAKDLTDPE